MKKFIMFVFTVALAGAVHAAALTAARSTPSRGGELTSLKVASNVVIYAGAMVAVDNAGLARPAEDAANRRVIGRAEQTVDNRTAVYDANKRIEASRGIFRWDNADTFTTADIGGYAYATNDQEVVKAAKVSHNVIAGVVVDVDSAGVWIDTLTIPSQGNGSYTDLAASGDLAVVGDASIGGDLTVTTDAHVVGDFKVNTDKFTVTASSGNTTVAGTLGVTGQATFTAIPKVTAVQAADTSTGIPAVLTNLPAAATADAAWFKIAVGDETYAVPMFQLP